MMSTLSDVIFDLVSADDLEDAIKIEQEGYPPDEAASIDTFRLRQSQAGNLFLGAYAGNNGASDTRKRRIVGYVCATLSPEKTLSHSSMSTHVPGAESVCIHSVCVDAAYKRRGLGLALLKEYIARLEKACAEDGAPYERVLLIVHEDLRVFYEKAGFEWLGKSEVKHGFKEWFEMRRQLRKPSESTTLGNEVAMELPHSDGPPQQQQLAGILEALQHGSGNRNKPPPRALAQFDDGGIMDVITPDGQRAGVSVNKYDLTCPRPGCGSVILKKGIATWVERSSVQMEPPGGPKHALLPMLPDPPETTHWWLVTPSPMAFENIGFTRPISITTEPQMKLLTCAECDLGPLGWTAVGGTEFWLACSRVAYLGY